MTNKLTIDEFITSIKNKFVTCSFRSIDDIKSFDYTTESIEGTAKPLIDLYTNGMCYWFARMLEEAFPGGMSYINIDIGHVMYRYSNDFWDIKGNKPEKGRYIPINYIPECAILDYKHVESYDGSDEENAWKREDVVKQLIEASAKIAELDDKLIIVC